MTQENQTPEAEGSKRQMSFTVLENGTVRAEFGPGLDPVEFDPSALPESIWASALAEGVISRLRSYGSKLQGENRTPANLREATVAGLEKLKAGEWKVERIPGMGEVSIEAEAAHVYRKTKAADAGEEYTRTLAEDAAAFAALSDEQKDKLKKTSRYLAAVAAVKAERNAKKAEKLAKKAKTEEEIDF